MCNSYAKSRVHFAAFHEASSHSTTRSWTEKPSKSGKLPRPPWTLVRWSLTFLQKKLNPLLECGRENSACVPGVGPPAGQRFAPRFDNGLSRG